MAAGGTLEEYTKKIHPSTSVQRTHLFNCLKQGKITPHPEEPHPTIEQQKASRKRASETPAKEFTANHPRLKSSMKRILKAVNPVHRTGKTEQSPGPSALLDIYSSTEAITSRRTRRSTNPPPITEQRDQSAGPQQKQVILSPEVDVVGQALSSFLDIFNVVQRREIRTLELKYANAVAAVNPIDLTAENKTVKQRQSKRQKKQIKI